jgi:hypothetical protein
MPKPVLFVMAKDPVNDIRSGISDVAMMQKYGVSARGLERLFKKLVEAGAIEQFELEQRMRSTQRSHAVDLETFPFPEAKKTRINPRDAVPCIRSGMSDTELMDRYNISARGLDSLFRKLVDAGEIDSSELESRKHGLEWAEIVFAPSAKEPEQFHGDCSAEDLPGRAGFKEFLELHKVYAAAIGGAVIGAFVVAAASLLINSGWPSIETSAPSVATTSSPGPPKGSSREAAQEIIEILEDVSPEQRPGNMIGLTKPSAYDECVQRCENQFDAADKTEQVLSSNCKRECLNEHSERFRAIRQRYYNPSAVRAR